MEDKKQHVYIIGSKGIPAKYGGFETFVEKLTEYQVDRNIQYHVACMTENSAKSGITDKHFEHNGAKCFNIDVPNIGPARAIYYDILALKYAIELSKKNNDEKPIFYILACRIGPFIQRLTQIVKEINGKVFINPDGHEWLRQKWSYPIKKYWKISERLMIKNSDLVICDSKNIQKYIDREYKNYNPKTIYISYGITSTKTCLTKNSKVVREWFKQKNICENDYYLVVGRFVPENNYEIMIREFMKSITTKDFVIITNVQKNKFYKKLKNNTNFEKDSRIKFVGTVYDQELLKYIRANAFAYIHGHEVGGTNPSLLEAMESTRLNLLLDVGFNREVGRKSAIYWKKSDELSSLITELDVEENWNKTLKELGDNSFLKKDYSWDRIVYLYEKIFFEI
ncbi:DUF1972 domain-containing protein [Enterococcus gilvus]|uniref:beta 1-4 rhamnosyltransferase Cps2T n=1 Tax=Enterococcus gilvus TaxID=160453 RepID=UPI003D6B8957